MKKYALILGAFLLSGGMVFAHFHETYEWHYGYDYHHRHMPPRPHRINGHTHYRVYYPATGISINIGNNYSPVGRAIRSSVYTPYKNNRRTSIFVSI